MKLSKIFKRLHIVLITALAVFIFGCGGNGSGGRETGAANYLPGEQIIDYVEVWNSSAAEILDIPMRYIPEGAGFFESGNDIITSAVIMAETEVTQELWKAVMTGSDNNVMPSYFLGAAFPPANGEIQDKRPVEYITWYDAIEFCNRLSGLTNRERVYTLTVKSRSLGRITLAAVTADFSKNGYRLPTEIEWLWAAAGAPNVSEGYNKAFAGSDGGNYIEDYAWYLGNSEKKTHEVGLKCVNELNLYDMTGNVEEWCWDWYGSFPTENGEADTFLRIYRGGYWNSIAGSCATADHLLGAPGLRFNSVGFRFVRTAD